MLRYFVTHALVCAGAINSTLVTLFSSLPHRFAVVAAFLFQTDPSTIPVPGDLDVQGLVTGFFEAVQAGKVMDWIAGAGVVAGVVAIRKWGGKIPKVGPYLESHPLVGFCLPFVLASVWGVGQALATGSPVKTALAAGATVAAKAITLYVGYRKVTEARTASRELAVATVTTKAEALAVHERGPQP